MQRVSVRFVAASLLALAVTATSAVANTGGQGRRASVPAEPQPRVQQVSVPAIYPAGSIVVVNNERKLYYITGRGQALRYGVAVGKNSELWMGKTFVAAKMVDPKWIPVNGDDPVEGGDPKNPLGKRALYLDWSLLRIHGTPSRGSIGSAVSNGCVRMLNEDVMDLFDRVHVGAPVFAIRSWKEASTFADSKVGEKIYVDPEAHRQAQEDLKEELAERARMKAEEARAQRFGTPTRQAQAPQSWGNGRPSQPIYTRGWSNPYASGSAFGWSPPRYGLGR